MTADAPADESGVRRARPGDRDAVLALQSVLARPTPDLLRAALDTDLGRVLISTADGVVVGYLLAVGRTAGPPIGAETDPVDSDLDDETADDLGAYVAELAVAPAHRREGRATDLLRALLSTVDGWVTLTAAPENTAARACYRALDFEVLRHEPAFFDGDPALVMGRWSGQ
jgi:Acetyltransferases